MLKYKADRIAVFYILIITSVFLIHWNLAHFNYFLYALELFMATLVFVIAHYHNHVPMWRSQTLNRLTNYWLTIFYGFPIYVWIPTHNLNHHKFNNKAGDLTITYRYSEKNNLATLLTYPIISSFFQQKIILQYLFKLRKNRPFEFWHCVSQYFILAVVMAGAFILDWKKALLFLVIPQQVTMFTVLVINYMQHVHADEESEFNHSRNFTGIMNKILLNSGLHTAHHERMGLHWSLLPEGHAKIADKIDDRLIIKNLAKFLFSTYILSLFFKKFQSQSMRLQRLRSENQSHLLTQTKVEIVFAS